MGFRPGAYFRLWDLEDKGKYSSGRITISKKDATNGGYVQKFGGFVRFVGQAHEHCKKLEIGSSGISLRIAPEIDACDLENYFSKEKNTTYYNPVIFKVEDSNGASSSGASKQTKKEESTSPAVDTLEDDDDDLPF